MHFKLLCLGASTTDQGTQSWPDTWCALLARRVERALGVRIEAAAFGRGGIGVTRARAELNRLTGAFRPDLVVALLGVNDITWLRGIVEAPTTEACRSAVPAWLSRFQMGRRISKGLWPIESESESGDRVEWHSQNVPTIRDRFRRLPEAVPADDPVLLDRVKHELDGLVGDMIAQGTAVVLLEQPTIWSDDLSDEALAQLWFPVRTEAGLVRASPGWLDRQMKLSNDMQRRVARASGASFVDLEPVIPKDLVHFFDDCHFTDRGSVAVAEVAAEAAAFALRGRAPAIGKTHRAAEDAASHAD